MIRNCFRRCAVSALLLLVASLAGAPTRAEDALDPRLFWRSPEWPGKPPDDGIRSVTAHPQGGVLLSVYLGGEKLRYLYRIDADGAVVWRLGFPEGLGVIAAAASDGGAFVCVGWYKVGYVDEQGRLDWAVQTEPTPADANMPWRFPLSCEGLLPLGDGSVVVATPISGGESYQSKTVTRIARIGADGRIQWSRSITADTNTGWIEALIQMPDGDIEIVLSTGEPFPAIRRKQVFWQWRISPQGESRPPNEMQRHVPDDMDWMKIEAFYLSDDRSIRIGGLRDYDRCCFPVEEWSIDGERLLARRDLAPPSRLLNEKFAFPASVGHLFHGAAGDLLVVSCGEDQNFLVTVDAAWSATWRRLRLDYIMDDYDVATSDGSRLYLLEGSDMGRQSIGSHQLGVVDLPW